MSENEKTRLVTAEELQTLKHMQKFLAAEYRRAAGMLDGNRDKFADSMSLTEATTVSQMRTAAATSAAGYAAVTDLLGKARLNNG